MRETSEKSRSTLVDVIKGVLMVLAITRHIIQIQYSIESGGTE